MVRGRLIETGEEAALFPGNLPEDPAAILAPGPPGRAATGPTPPTASPASRRRVLTLRPARGCRTSASTAPPSS